MCGVYRCRFIFGALEVHRPNGKPRVDVFTTAIELRRTGHYHYEVAEVR
jgi:hypothetical protein